MVRPATPLTVLLLVAFGLLLLSVLTTPIISALSLGSFQGTDFGVFGYCKGSSCTSIEIGYGSLATSTESSDFDLPTSTRSTLSSILIVHPVAALLTFVMLVLAIVSHFHSPSHSSRYLLLVFIMSIVTFLVCLLAFLVDVLLFVPHMAVGSWLVLAGTVLVALGSLVTCAMRRTVVGKKARAKRIAQNTGASGANYYNSQGQVATAPVAVTFTSLEPTMPVLSGALSDEKRQAGSSEERIPLTLRSPSQRHPNNYVADEANSTADVPYGGRPLGSNQPRPGFGGSSDRYENAIGPADGYGLRGGSSFERGRGRGGLPTRGTRGLGGYPGPGKGSHGGYGGHAPPPGRGAYGSSPRGRGGYGPMPRGYGGPGGPGLRGGRTPPPGYPGRQGPYNRGQLSHGPGFPSLYAARQPSPGLPSAPGYNNLANAPYSDPDVSDASNEALNPRRASLPRAESPPPLPGLDNDQAGQALEMDRNTWSPSHATQDYGQFGLRDCDADVAGMMAMQQQGRTPLPQIQPHDTHMSENTASSTYLPRQSWSQGPEKNPPVRIGSPPSQSDVPGSSGGNDGSAPQAVSGTQGGEYYEDVDPQFANLALPAPPNLPNQAGRSPSPNPPSLRPSAASSPERSREQSPSSPQPPIQTSHQYAEEALPDGILSPVESERSHFTSISERGINPKWNPPPSNPMIMSGSGAYSGMGGHVMPRRPVNRSADMLLNSNPDFELPARESPSQRGGGGGEPVGLGKGALGRGGPYPTGI